MVINPFPSNMFLDTSKLKAFADNKINITKKQKFSMGWVGNIVEKGESASNQHFPLFPQCFQNAFFQGR